MTNLVSITVNPPAEKLFGDLTQNMHLRIAKGARTWAERLQTRGKIALRQDVRQAGLGDRLPNVWRADIFPRSASAHTHAPAVMFSVSDKAKTQRTDSFGTSSTIASAADIIRAHTEGVLLKSRNGLFMAIPTKNTPRVGRRPATPHEVELKFNQDLIIKRARSGQSSLAFVDAVRSKNGKGFRHATKGRARQGRKPELVLMFVLLKTARLRAKLHWPQIFKDLEAFARQAWPEEIAAAVNAGSN